jgi:radical SAM protein (TIGR01212 family)
LSAPHEHAVIPHLRPLIAVTTRTLSDRLRARHPGERVFRIVVDAGFTCPNRDGSKGYGGCTYCNVDSFTPALPRGLPSLREQVAHGARRAREKYRATKFVVYFQPNTNTYAPVDVLRAKLDEALAACPEDVVGLAVGTRPDCLDAEKVALLESYAARVAVEVELGMESMHDATLRAIRRGCTHADFVAAMALLRDARLEVCVHTVFGLPGETRGDDAGGGRRRSAGFRTSARSSCTSCWW